jgi:shikimate dehydrogenase
MLDYSSLSKQIMNDHQLIINTTPLGMYPKIDDYPQIPYNFITNKHLLYDLIYNPEETRFLRFGKEKGAQIQNGLRMLELQADYSWKIWNDL